MPSQRARLARHAIQQGAFAGAHSRRPSSFAAPASQPPRARCRQRLPWCLWPAALCPLHAALINKRALPVPPSACRWVDDNKAVLPFLADRRVLSIKFEVRGGAGVAAVTVGVTR